jgi:hypothetical protein
MVIILSQFAVILSAAKNLALNIFKAMRDSSSPAPIRFTQDKLREGSARADAAPTGTRPDKVGGRQFFLTPGCPAFAFFTIAFRLLASGL